MRRSRTHEAVMSMVGFGCNQAFLFSLFYLGANRAADLGFAVVERAELLGLLLCLSVSFFVVSVLSQKARNALFVPPLIWCYAILLAIGYLTPRLFSIGFVSDILFQSLCVGLPFGLMICAWGRCLGTSSIGQSIPEAFIATALAAAGCFIISSLPDMATMVIPALFPLGSALFLGLLGTRGDDGTASGSPVQDSTDVAFGAPVQGDAASHTFVHDGSNEHAQGGSKVADGASGADDDASASTSQLTLRILIGTAVLGFAAGAMETLGSEPGMDSTPTLPLALLILGLYCLGILQWFGRGRLRDSELMLSEPSDGNVSRQGPLDNAYRLAILLMVGGFLFIPVLQGLGMGGESVVLAGYLAVMLVFISLFLVMARITGQDPTLSFARGFLALFLGEAVGIIVANLIDAAALPAIASSAVSAMAGLAALYAYLFLFTENDLRSLSVVVAQTDRFEDICETIAHDAGLSAREAEILPLALKGRSGERIASELFISKNTVETHMRRIYAKCGVHNRQELIDLGERTRGHHGSNRASSLDADR